MNGIPAATRMRLTAVMRTMLMASMKNGHIAVILVRVLAGLRMEVVLYTSIRVK